MSESEKPGVRVNDRRRFDPEGEARAAEPAVAPAAEPGGRSGEGPGAGPARGPERRAAREEVARLEQELEAARRRVDELARAVQAGERDREDFKRRLTRERDRVLEVEKGNVALSLLETVDELELCLRAADDSPLARGVRMIRDGILSRLATLGVERVPLEGQPFDPRVAEAVDLEITGVPEEDQQVTLELRAAWRAGERIIRAGRVRVGKYVPPAQA